MTKNEKLAIIRDRLNKLENKSINLKCPGVRKKLERQLRNADALNK